MAMTLSREMRPKLAALNLVLNALAVEPAIETVDDRKRVQKAVYLAQVFAGVDLGYRYSWYKKGPYSPKLTRDYYSLAEALELGEKPSDVKLQDADVGKLQAIREMFTVPPGVDLQAEDWLELLASLDFLKRVSKKVDADIDRVIQGEKESLHQYVAVGKDFLQQHGG